MSATSAQVSIYPLGERDLAPAIDTALEVFRGRGLDVHPGPMSTRLDGDARAVFGALEQAYERIAAGSHVVMVVTLSNACPVGGGQAVPR